MTRVLCLCAPENSTQLHRPRPLLSRPVFLIYPVGSPKHIIPVPPSCTRPATFPLCILCADTAVHARSRWNICFRSFLFSLCFKFKRCSQYKRQSTSSSSLISSAFAIFLFPAILLFNPLQFSPISRKIPCCFVFGATLWTCSSSSFTVLITHLCSSFAAMSPLFH